MKHAKTSSGIPPWAQVLRLQWMGRVLEKSSRSMKSPFGALAGVCLEQSGALGVYAKVAPNKFREKWRRGGAKQEMLYKFIHSSRLHSLNLLYRAQLLPSSSTPSTSFYRLLSQPFRPRGGWSWLTGGEESNGPHFKSVAGWLGIDLTRFFSLRWRWGVFSIKLLVGWWGWHFDPQLAELPFVMSLAMLFKMSLKRAELVRSVFYVRHAKQTSEIVGVWVVILW